MLALLFLLAVVHGDAVLRAVARDDAHAADLLGDGLHVRLLELDLPPEAHAVYATLVSPDNSTMMSSGSLPKSCITPFCMPRPAPSSRMSMKMPQNTPNAVSSVRSLFCRSVKRISCRPSSMAQAASCERVRRSHQAVLQDDLALGLVGDVLLVRHDDHRVAAPVDVLEQRHDLLRGAAVERAGRLVGEDHLGLADQRARDGHALLLAARQLVGHEGLAIRQPDQVEELLGAVVALLAADALVVERQRDVLRGVLERQQVEGLEHEARAACCAGARRRSRPDSFTG